MDVAKGLVLPAFFAYYDAPVKLVADQDGGVAAWRLSKDTGGWLPASHLIDKILFGEDGEIEQLTRDEFVQRTEHDRGYYLRGEGPIFALYDTVRAIREVQVRERRPPTPEERALIEGIQRRTFVMFEEMLQGSGDEAADPSLAIAPQ